MKRTKAILMAALVFPAGPATRVIDRDTDDPMRLRPEKKIEMNLQTLDIKSRRSVSPVSAPWSDVTWKANKGLINERIVDPSFQKSPGWRGKYEYLRKYNIAWMLKQPARDRDRWLGSLSPAEKYDLLMGTVKGGLADNVSAFLNESIKDEKEFPGWWGLCEGSAASTVYYPEPQDFVLLRSEAYGIDVPFFAPDIKGLATMLWSRFNRELALPEAGLQCKKEGPGCFDSNPASFHASIHHYLDLEPGLLVGEMDPSPVVWNFPIVAYQETYFRPDLGAMKPARDLRSAALAAEHWSGDPRRGLRAPGTAYVVGIKMNLSYAVNQAQNPPFRGSLKRKINSRVLVYELELDSQWNLIGGEWVSGKHPDLLWTVPKGLKPDSIGDRLLPPWNPDGDSIPKTWEKAARVSANQLTPLRRVVELLVQRSAKTSE